MKVFISWSGGLSFAIAQVLNDWLPNVIQAVEPYLSSEDIEKGTRWLIDMSKELEDSSFGIICLTSSNQNEPWILFEAGALSKSLTKSRVAPLLIDLKPSDIKGPLVQFQATTLAKGDVLSLLTSINQALGDKQLKEKQLQGVFEVWWPKLEGDISKALKDSKLPKDKKSSRGDREILEEILELTRTISQDTTRMLSSTEMLNISQPISLQIEDSKNSRSDSYNRIIDKLRRLQREQSGKLTAADLIAYEKGTNKKPEE